MDLLDDIFEDGEFGIEEFGMALGLGDEMSQENRELLDILRWQKEKDDRKKKENLGKPEVVSIKTRRSRHEREISKFERFVEAVLKGEIDLDFEEFNRANPTGKR